MFNYALALVDMLQVLLEFLAVLLGLDAVVIRWQQVSECIFGSKFSRIAKLELSAFAQIFEFTQGRIVGVHVN